MRVRNLIPVLAAALALGGTAHASDFIAVCGGGEEVPPVDTHARATATFKVSLDGTAIDYRLVGANIDNAVVSHIHLAPAGQNGGVVAFLFGPVPAGGGRSNGVLAEGTITAANLVGALAGQPLSALLDAMTNGGAYVNVHTNDGIDPPNTGVGDTLSGEVRGQIRVASVAGVE